MIRAWKVYRLDDPTDAYWLWALERDAAIRSARLEHFGLVLNRSALGCSRA